MMGSWKGRGNQYIQFVRVLYCKLSTNDKQIVILFNYIDITTLSLWPPRAFRQIKIYK